MSRTKDLHQCIVNAVTDEDVRDIARAMIDLAKSGDKTAARLILGYLETPTAQELNRPALTLTKNPLLK
jgi:hypothetical protein